MSKSFSELQGIIAGCGTGTNRITINLDDDIVDDLGFDSLAIIELVIEVENHFDIEIEDGMIDDIRTVRQMTNIIDDLV